MASYDEGIRLPNNETIVEMLEDVFETREAQESFIVREWGHVSGLVCNYEVARLPQEDLNKLQFELQYATCRQELEDAVNYYLD